MHVLCIAGPTHIVQELNVNTVAQNVRKVTMQKMYFSPNNWCACPSVRAFSTGIKCRHSSLERQESDNAKNVFFTQ